MNNWEPWSLIRVPEQPGANKAAHDPGAQVADPGPYKPPGAQAADPGPSKPPGAQVADPGPHKPLHVIRVPKLMIRVPINHYT